MQTIITFLLGAAVVFAWGPWVDQGYVHEKLTVYSQKEAEKSGSTEPCLYTQIVSSSRVPFGYSVTAQYACFTPDTMERRMFVTSTGNVFILSKFAKTGSEE